MKELPRFSEAIIQPSLSQLQMKLLLLALNEFLYSLDTQTSPDVIKTALERSIKLNGFKISTDYIQQPDKFNLHLQLIHDLLIDAYCLEKFKYQDIANHFLHETYLENFDADTFDIPEGEILRVAENG